MLHNGNRAMLRKTLVTFCLLLALLLPQSCIITPKGGVKLICSKSSVESQERGAYLAKYTPIDSLIEYRDSLVNIKMKIIEVYAECPYYEQRSILPHLSPRYVMQDGFQLVIRFAIDSSSTPNRYTSGSDKGTWWTIGYNTEPQTIYCVSVHDMCHMKVPVRLDSISIPMYFGTNYRNTVWADNNHEDVLIRRIRFVLEDTSFYRGDRTYSSVVRMLEKRSTEMRDYTPIRGDKERTIAEMNEKYSLKVISR